MVYLPTFTVKLTIHVGRYTIHGWCGIGNHPQVVFADFREASGYVRFVWQRISILKRFLTRRTPDRKVRRWAKFTKLKLEKMIHLKDFQLTEIDMKSTQLTPLGINFSPACSTFPLRSRQ